MGFLSFFLLWLAIVWGLVLRNGWALTRIRHATIYGIHQTVALLGLCLAAVHGFAQLAVPDGPVTLVHTLLPFSNPFDPVGIGVGVLALELIVAATASVLIQRRLGYTRWRALHAITYAAFMLIVAHVLMSGSDVGPTWVWGSVLGSWLVTVLLWLTTTGWVRNVRRGVAEKSSARQRGQEITVNVDAQRCARFGFCEHEAPAVFRLRGDGRLSYRASVPVEEAESVIRAVEVCPARAIALTKPPTSVLTPRRVEPAPEDELPERMDDRLEDHPVDRFAARRAHNGHRPTLSGSHRHDTLHPGGFS